MSYADIDRTLGPVLDFHAEHGRSYSELENRLKAAEGDRAAALKAYIASSEDAEVVKLRNGITTLQAKLQAMAEKNVVSETLSENDKKKLSEELEKTKFQFRDGRKAIISIMNSMGAAVDSEKINQALEEIGDPTKSGRGRKPGSTGSSLPKASATLKLQSSAGGEAQTFDTFGAAAKALNVPVEKLQLAFALSAGVEHNEIASVDKPQSFILKAGSDLPGSTVDWTVSTQPKARKKPGPRPGGNKAAA